MKIGLDFDGVIVNSGKLKVEIARTHLAVDLPLSKLNRRVAVTEGYLSEVEYKELKRLIYATREIGLQVNPVEHAVHYLSLLLRDEHDVCVITSRTGVPLEIAKEWLYLRDVKVDIVGVGYNESKATATKGVEMYLDDDLSKLLPLIGLIPHIFLFSWEYNKHLSTKNIAIRVSSWEEFYEITKNPLLAATR